MLALPAFRSFFQPGAGGADVVRPPQHVHPLVQRPLEGRCGGLYLDGHVGGEYSRAPNGCKGIRLISGQIHLDLELRSRMGVPADSSTGPEESSSATLWPARGSLKLSVPTATSVAPAAMNSRASAPLEMPPMPTIGIWTAAATARTWATAIGRTADPERPPWPAAMPGRPVAGSIALAFNVLINDTASAPPSSAATATAAGSATLGVSFTISGFSVSGRNASNSAAVSVGCSPTIRPEWTLGQETFSSIAATSSLSPLL